MEKKINGPTETAETSGNKMSKQEKQDQIRKAFKESKCRNSIFKDIDEYGNPGIICLTPVITLIVGLLVILKYCFLDKDAVENRNFVYWIYSKPDIAILLWMPMMGSIFFLFFPAFCLWVNLRKSLPKTGFKDYLFLALYAVYIISIYVTLGYGMCFYDLGPIASVFISMEQIRVTLKIHSFVREGAREVLKFEKAKKGESKVEEVWSPKFEKFLYFMFAPTLIYCDYYARTESVNWKRFFYFLFAFLCCTPLHIITCSTLARLYARDFIEDSFLSFKKWAYIIVILLTSNPTVLTGLAYGFWHCYNNAWAEILRFGDRHFYGDYWNGTSFREFMARWAAPLHIWFHLYIYMDISNIFPMGRKYALMMTMVVSAALHDYVLFAINKHFFPAYNWIMFVVAVFFPGAFFAKFEKPSPAIIWCLTSVFQVVGGYILILKLLCDVDSFNVILDTLFGSVYRLLFG